MTRLAGKLIALVAVRSAYRLARRERHKFTRRSIESIYRYERKQALKEGWPVEPLEHNRWVQFVKDLRDEIREKELLYVMTTRGLLRLKRGSPMRYRKRLLKGVVRAVFTTPPTSTVEVVVPPEGPAEVREIEPRRKLFGNQLAWAWRVWHESIYGKRKQ